jgi:hypothetical protein
MIKSAKFLAVVAAQQIIDLNDMGNLWPRQITILARDGLSEVAVAVEISTPTTPAFPALTAVPTDGAYLLPKVAGFMLPIGIPYPPPDGGDLKIHVFGTATSTTIGIFAE